MARYNSVAPVGSQSGAGTILTPDQGLFTTLTGTAPYTVTLTSPALSTGVSQSFWNNTSGLVTLSTPSGSIRGPSSNTGSSYVTYPNTITILTSTGSDYVLTGNVGGWINVDVTTTYTAKSNQLLWVNTSSGAITVTLPANPNKGDTIRIVDIANNFDSNALTLARNSQPIMGSAEDLTVNTEGAAFDMIYYDASRGWRIFTI